MFKQILQPTGEKKYVDKMAELESLKSQFESNVEDPGVKKEYF